MHEKKKGMSLNVFKSTTKWPTPKKHDFFIVPQSSKQNIYPGTKEHYKKKKEKSKLPTNLGSK